MLMFGLHGRREGWCPTAHAFLCASWLPINLKLWMSVWLSRAWTGNSGVNDAYHRVNAFGEVSSWNSQRWFSVRRLGTAEESAHWATTQRWKAAYWLGSMVCEVHVHVLYIILGWQRIPLYACSLSLIFKLARARVLTQSTSCQYNTVKARCVKYALISLRSQHGCVEWNCCSALYMFVCVCACGVTFSDFNELQDLISGIHILSLSLT